MDKTYLLFDAQAFRYCFRNLNTAIPCRQQEENLWSCKTLISQLNLSIIFSR